MSDRRLLKLLCSGVVCGGIALLTWAGAAYASPPVKLELAGQMGREVDATTGARVCTVSSGDQCQPGREGSGPGEFRFVTSVAAGSPGVIYVGDDRNHRVQELTPAGAFVSMFGGDVNETKDQQPSATAAERDVCTAASGDHCTAGVEGTGEGQFGGIASVAVERTAPYAVYVLEAAVGNFRLDKYTAGGEFVWTIGKGVNEATGGNLCTAQEVTEGVTKCGPGAETSGSTEPGALANAPTGGDEIAVGGPEGLIYVGDEHRVQEFTPAGKWVRDLSLASISSAPLSRVSALAVDPSGDLDLVYEVHFASDTIRSFNAAGHQVGEQVVSGQQGRKLEVQALSIDATGHLALSEQEETQGVQFIHRGVLETAATGHRLTEFPISTPFGTHGISFDEQGNLYAAVSSAHEVLTYAPFPVAEIGPRPASCSAGSPIESSATFECALAGEVNPEEVQGTEAWFEWGLGPLLGGATAHQPVATGATVVPLQATLAGLAPNQPVYYRLAGLDANVQPPEQLMSEPATVTTPTVAPRSIGAPSASFVRATSAVLRGEVNPENAGTSFHFQYGPCPALDSCSTAASTAAAQSAAYGRVATTLEAQALQPDTAYRYRLVAVNPGGEARGREASFETPALAPPEAITGQAGAVRATSAMLSGAVDPAGRPGTYSFELAVDEGGNTQFALLASGPVGPEVTQVPVSMPVAGLQPGVQYAFRVTVSTGFGSATGQPVTFTTLGAPALLLSPAPPALLAVPAIAFPSEAPAPSAKPNVKSKCKRGYKRAKRGRCVKAKKAKHRGKGARAKRRK